MGFNWKSALGGVAPTLARALGVGGGPAGVAIAAVSRALLGHDKGSDADLEAALVAGATPEQLEKLRAAEQEFTLKLFDSAVALERIEADDRANARAKETATRDRMPGILAIILTLGVAGVLVAMARVEVPAANREPLVLMLGTLAGAWSSAMAYYFGSSSGSKAKDTVLGRIAGGGR